MVDLAVDNKNNSQLNKKKRVRPAFEGRAFFYLTKKVPKIKNEKLKKLRALSFEKKTRNLKPEFLIS